MNSSSGHGLEKGRYSTPLVTKFKVLIQRRYLATGVVTLLAIAIMTATVAVQVTNRVTGAGADDQATDSVTANSSISSKVRHVLDEIASNINSSVDPCDDFYEYACGSFPQRYSVPNGRKKINYHTLHVDRMYRTIISRLKGDKLLSKDTIKPLGYLKRIWDSCVNDDSDTSLQTNKLLEYFKELDQLDSWREKFTKLTKDGYNVLFTVKIDPLYRGDTRVVIGPPEYENEKAYVSLHTLPLLNYYESLLGLLKKDPLLLRTWAISAIDLEYTVFKAHSEEKEVKLVASMMDITNFSRDTTIDWHKVLNQLIKANFTESTHVLIASERYRERFQNFVDGIDLATEREMSADEYLKLATIQQSCFFLGNECRDFQYQLNQNVQTPFIEKFDNRTDFVEKVCFDKLKKHLEDLMFRVWESEDENVEEAQTYYLDIIKTLVPQLSELIDQISWMDQATKDRAQKLIQQVHIASSTNGSFYVVDDLILERKYMKAPFFATSGKLDIFDFFRSIISHLKTEEFNLIDHGPSWPISLFSSLPFLAQQTRQLFLPNFFVQGPFSAPDLPAQIQFGFFVSMLAREMTHTFDAVANFYGCFNDPCPFWSDWTKDNFNRTMKCLADFHQNQTTGSDGPGESIIIDSNFSINDNLAELFGVRVAYEAFKLANVTKVLNPSAFPDLLKDQTDDRLFFLSYANVHCSNQIKLSEAESTFRQMLELPRKLRVNLVVAHTDSFARAFECPTGSKMNPIDKCPFM